MHTLTTFSCFSFRRKIVFVSIYPHILSARHTTGKALSKFPSKIVAPFKVPCSFFPCEIRLARLCIDTIQEMQFAISPTILMDFLMIFKFQMT